MWRKLPSSKAPDQAIGKPFLNLPRSKDATASPAPIQAVQVAALPELCKGEAVDVHFQPKELC